MVLLDLHWSDVLAAVPALCRAADFSSSGHDCPWLSLEQSHLVGGTIRACRGLCCLGCLPFHVCRTSRERRTQTPFRRPRVTACGNVGLTPRRRLAITRRLTPSLEELAG